MDWYYFSRCAVDDVIVFKGFDTAMEDQTVYHTAFVNSQAGPRAVPRSSIEVRLFAFWS
jgi:hypothetical protein